MAYGIVLEFTGVDKSQYDAVNAQLGLDPDTGKGDWPAGLVTHAGGPTADGWIVMEVWDSQTAQEAFMGGRLGAALGVVGLPAPARVTDSDLRAYHAP